MSAEESSCVMKRGWQRGWRDHRGASAWFEESQPVVPANLVFDAQPFVESDEVRAAAEQHVLAVVHHFAGARMLIRRSASAEIRPALEQGHPKATLGKGAPGGESRQSTPHHGDSGNFAVGPGSSGKAFQEALSQNPELSRTVRLTLRLKTSYSLSAILSSSRW